MINLNFEKNSATSVDQQVTIKTVFDLDILPAMRTDDQFSPACRFADILGSSARPCNDRDWVKILTCHVVIWY